MLGAIPAGATIFYSVIFDVNLRDLLISGLPPTGKWVVATKNFPGIISAGASGFIDEIWTNWNGYASGITIVWTNGNDNRYSKIVAALDSADWRNIDIL